MAEEITVEEVATPLTFEDKAPTISGLGVKQADVDAVELPDVSVATSPPELTKELTALIMAEFANLDGSMSFLDIARKVGATTSQVKTVYGEVVTSQTTE